MAEETGSVTSAREAILRLRLTAGEAVECLVDTGFTGALVLPQSMVARLGIPIVGREVFGSVAKNILATISCVEEDVTASIFCVVGKFLQHYLQLQPCVFEHLPDEQRRKHERLFHYLVEDGRR